VVSNGDKSFPANKTVTLKNPDLYQLRWRAETTDIDKNRIFGIKPSNGRIESGEQVEITVSFNPQLPQDYEALVDFFIDDKPKPYGQLAIRGTGTYPKITFDRREVVLPIVPLNFVAKSTFHIKNEGHE
jgi:hypothetical protein